MAPENVLFGVVAIGLCISRQSSGDQQLETKRGLHVSPSSFSSVHSGVGSAAPLRRPAALPRNRKSHAGGVPVQVDSEATQLRSKFAGLPRSRSASPPPTRPAPLLDALPVFRFWRQRSTGKSGQAFDKFLGGADVGPQPDEGIGYPGERTAAGSADRLLNLLNLADRQLGANSQPRARDERHTPAQPPNLITQGLQPRHLFRRDWAPAASPLRVYPIQSRHRFTLHRTRARAADMEGIPSTACARGRSARIHPPLRARAYWSRNSLQRARVIYPRKLPPSRACRSHPQSPGCAGAEGAVRAPFLPYPPCACVGVGKTGKAAPSAPLGCRHRMDTPTKARVPLRFDSPTPASAARTRS